MANTHLARLPPRQEMCSVVTAVEVDHEKCTGCGVCVKACPTEAAERWYWISYLLLSASVVIIA